MAIYITGDIHGSHTIRKFAEKNFPSEGLTRDDYVIILGDFGLVWCDPPSKDEIYWLDWLEDKPWTTLFIDGNHDNHAMLESMDVSGWHGGSVHFIRDHVIHLTRGQVFDIDGRTFFTMGGASSIDKDYRTEGVSWWPQKIPSAEERALAATKITEVGKVDYVLTHCPPARELVELGMEFGFTPFTDKYSNWLQTEVADRLEFKQWFYGHMHLDRWYWRPYTPLYDVIYCLDIPGGMQGALESKMNMHAFA